MEAGCSTRRLSNINNHPNVPPYPNNNINPPAAAAKLHPAAPFSPSPFPPILLPTSLITFTSSVAFNPACSSVSTSGSNSLSPSPSALLSQHTAVMSATLPSWKDRQQGRFSTVHIQIPWRSIQLLVPHRIRRRLRSKLRNRQSPASSITSLQTSFSPTHTIRALQSHRWSLYDGQYLLLAFLGIFSLCVIQTPGALVKTAVATLLLTSLVLPITRQFFLPFLPIAAWLVFFYAAS